MLLLATAVWGLAYLVTHSAMRDVSPLPFVGVRFLTAALAVRGISGRRLGYIGRVEWRGGAAIGAAMLAGYGLQAAGLRQLSPGASAFISGLYVPIVPLLQWAITRQAPRMGAWAAVGLACLGMMLMAGAIPAQAGRNEAYALAGAFAIAAEIVLVARFAPRADPRRLAIAECMLVGAGAWALIGAGGVRFVPGLHWIGCAILLGCLSAFLQISANWSMQSLSATKATLIFATEPVWAALFSALAGESLTASAWMGGALILAAQGVAALPGRKRRQP